MSGTNDTQPCRDMFRWWCFTNGAHTRSSTMLAPSGWLRLTRMTASDSKSMTGTTRSVLASAVIPKFPCQRMTCQDVANGIRVSIRHEGRQTQEESELVQNTNKNG